MASFRRSIVASVLFTLFGGPGIVLVLIPWLITRFRIPTDLPPEHLVAGPILIVIGLVPLLESIARFVWAGRGALVPNVPTEHLVVSGLYRFVRNPMYVGVLIAILGETLLLWNRGMLLEFFAVAVAFQLFVQFYEEPRLLRTFSIEYVRYRQNVPRWLPRLTPWHAESKVSIKVS